MAIDIYYLNFSPPCRAVMLTAKQLNIDLNIKHSTGGHLDPDFLKINPAYTVPTINDNGFILWESRAIMQYLCNKYAPESGLYPSDTKSRALVDRWLNFDLTLWNAGRAAFFPKLVFGVEPTAEQLKPIFDSLKIMDQLIGDNKYLATDELTIADLSVVVSVSNFDDGVFKLAQGLDDYPNIQKWFANVKNELPYYDSVNTIDWEEVKEFFKKVRLLIESSIKVSK